MRELYGDKYASLGHLLDDMIRVHMESKGDVYADWRGRMLAMLLMVWYHILSLCEAVMMVWRPSMVLLNSVSVFLIRGIGGGRGVAL